MMNWTEIEEKYPSAYGKLFAFTYRSFFNMTDYELKGYLCHFFDANKIFVLPDVCFWKNGRKIVTEWGFEIHNKKEKLFKSSPKDIYKDRNEAETVAFTKAFELLENKINLKEAK